MRTDHGERQEVVFLIEGQDWSMFTCKFRNLGKSHNVYVRGKRDLKFRNGAEGLNGCVHVAGVAQATM